MLLNWRRIILIGLIVLFGTVVLTHFVAATELVSTLQRGQPLWVMVALALELLWLFNQTALYQSLYVLMQLPAYMSQMLPIVLASNFINFAAPSACLGGIALFVDDARLRGLKASRVMLVNLLFMVFNLAFFAILLIFGLSMLYIWHNLKLYQLLGGAILLTNIGLLAGGLLLAGTQPKGVVCLLNTSSSIINRLGLRLFKRNLLSERKVLRFALEFSEAAAAVRRAKQHLGRPLLHALLITLLDMSVLYACLVAFPSGGTPISMTVLVTGYSIGVLFMCLSITPQGLGVADGVMAATFVSLGVPIARATVAVLVYRGLSFWLPLLSGFVAIRWVKSLGRSAA